MRQGSRYSVHRHYRDGSLGVYAAVLARAKTRRYFFDSMLNSNAYIELLQSELVDWIDGHHRIGALFQQDSAPCYFSRQTKNSMPSIGLEVMDWPLNSPDVNLI